MYHHQYNSFGLPTSFGQQQMEGHQQYQQNYGGDRGQIEQQQQQWIGGIGMPNQQQIMAKIPPMTDSSIGIVSTLKRKLDSCGDGGNAKDKENLGMKRARIGLEHSGADPPMPDEEEEAPNQGGHNENAEEEDDEEEDDWNSGRSSSKTDEGSSSENSPIQQSNQQQQNNDQIRNIVEKGQGNGNAGVHGQHEAKVQEIQTPLQKFMVANSPYTTMPSTPLAHSTPMLAGNIYANPRSGNVLRNFQQYYVNPAMIGSCAIAQMPFNQIYGIGTQQQGHSAPFSVPQIQQQTQSQLQYSTAYSAQQLMTYGISPNASNYSNTFIHPNQSTLPSFNCSSLHGLGIECGEQKALTNLKNTNESSSSSGGGTDESSIGGSSSAPNLSIAKKNDQQILLFAVKFPPYIRQILQNGQKQWANLEEIMFGNSVPARLSLLNNNKKYPISLAEIHRRLSIPECLNTSYLSGILRRAKNKDGGSKLRQQLAVYDCGLELQTGKRKSSQVTTYTTLCEREALQLAEDFGKIANDPHNGFPHHQLAMELSRRSMLHSSPEQRKQRLEDVKGTMELLRSAISILEQSIGQETLQLSTTMLGQTAAVDDHQQLTPQTLDQFKRFARLSHCFGNRAVLICWETMLNVFGHFERIHQSGDATNGNGQSSPSAFLGSGTSQQQNDEQMSANSLLKLVKSTIKNNSSSQTSANN